MNIYSPIFVSVARPKDETKIDVIFEATLTIVLKTGFNGLKMADVAKAAKLGTGTLYIYFKNKEVLINRLYFTIKKKTMEQLLEVFNPEETFQRSFKKLWYNYLQISMNEPERMIFIEQFVRSSYLTKKTKEQSDRLLKPLEKFLKVGIQHGLVKNLPPELLLGQLLGPIYEIVKLHFDEKMKITPKLIDESFNMAWDSIRCKKK